MKTAILNAALVGAGGFIGAICRYGMSTLVQRNAGDSLYPYGTHAVNMLGCLLIGLAIGFAESRQAFGEDFRLFALIGVLGGFTTYSSFAYESLALIQVGEHMRAATYVLGHVLVGLGLVWCGLVLASKQF